MMRFVGMLQFLTRITIIKELPFDEEFHRGIIYFPLVGFLQGLVIAAVFAAVELLIGAPVAAIFTIIAYLCLTGALHLDGLGDTFDGFYSSRNREAILSIMKDSRLGTYGMAAIFFVLLVKIAGLQEASSSFKYTSLLLMPVFGKLALVLGCYNSSYARESGLGGIFIGKVSREALLGVLGLTLLLSLIHVESIAFIPVAFLIVHFVKKHSQRKIQGMTGDTLGAVSELVEVGYVLFLLVLIKWF